MRDLAWVPEGIDTTVPSVARTYVRLNRPFPRRAYRDRLAPGSYPVMSHATADDRAGTMRRAAATVRESRSKDNLVPRAHAEVTELFGGYELVEPGVVGHALWRPDGAGDVADRAQVRAGIGQEPDRQPRREPVTGGR